MYAVSDAREKEFEQQKQQLIKIRQEKQLLIDSGGAGSSGRFLETFYTPA